MAEIARHIDVEGAHNVRDLGGYPTEDGRQTQWRRLIRSANLDQISPVGQHKLVQYGLKTVIDLRDEIEVQQYPDVFAQSGSVRYLNLPLSREGFASSMTYARLDELYCQYLSVFQANIRAIIAAIAEAEASVLFHCAVGKDRTGIVSALLLGAVGVPVDVIAEDYAQTTRHIAHLVAQWREVERANGHDMLAFERDVAAEAATMLATLDVLDTQYGGAASYLRLCGVTDAQLASIQALLVG